MYFFGIREKTNKTRQRAESSLTYIYNKDDIARSNKILLQDTASDGRGHTRLRLINYRTYVRFIQGFKEKL